MMHHIDAKDVDFVVPNVAVVFQGILFEEVLLDGGSGANILPEEVYRKLKLGATLSPAPFQVKMADQRRVQPLGILKQQAIEIAVASGLKTPAANALTKEGTLSGSKQRKLLLGSPTIDSKSPFKVSWKDLEEPESKMNFFTMGSESKKSESKGKKITLFPKGIVGSAGKSVPKSLLAKEGSSANHGTMGMFPAEEATNYLADLTEMQKISTRLLQEKSDKERLQEEVTRLTAKAKAMTTEILSVVEDFQQWVDGLKTAVDEQFKELDEKGMTGVLVADSDVDALKKEVLEYAQEMWNRETKLWREHMAVSTEQFKNWFLCAGQESVRRENEALKIENERLIAEMEEMKNNKKEIEESLSKLKGELSNGLLESDQNLAIEVESDVEKQADSDFVAKKEEQETVGQKTKQPSIPTRKPPRSPLQDDDDVDYDVADDDDAEEQDKVGQMS
ncbi:hypothetical protein L7F22_001335 [Adiantum nelumboides]|nr:hypothetical protein [Adiantum nelumboides]